jgi:hypothetical protein
LMVIGPPKANKPLKGITAPHTWESHSDESEYLAVGSLHKAAASSVFCFRYSKT